MSVSQATTLPLAGVRVLDFSGLLPGPMATLLLAEAGAEVLQVERPHAARRCVATRRGWGRAAPTTPC